MPANDLTLTWTTTKPAASITDAVCDVRAWWGADIAGTAGVVGETFTFEVPGIHKTTIRVEQITPGQLVQWKVLENWMSFVVDQTEWVGTTIRLAVSPSDSGNTLTFTHVGLTPAWECYEACADGWGFYIGSSLRNLVETGLGEPHGNPAEAEFQEAAGIQQP